MKASLSVNSVKTRLRGLNSGCAAVIFLFALCHSTVAAAEGQQAVIGGIFDLSSGAGGSWGRAERNGVALAIEQHLQSGGAPSIKLVIEDSAYDNARAVRALQKLIEVDKARYIIGPTWEVFTAAIPICERTATVCIAPSSNNSAFDAPLKYAFTLWFDERDYAKAHLQFLEQQRGKRAAVITGISPYYELLAETLIQGMRQPPVSVERLPSDQRDYRSVILRIPKQLDLLLVFMLGDGAAQSFFRQWSELRRDRPLVLTDDALLYFDPQLDLAALGFSVRYSLPVFDAAAARNFNAEYAARFGSAPEAPSAAVAYDAARILLQCLRQSTQQDSVRTCISTTKGFDGASGVISIENQRAAQPGRVVVRMLEPVTK